VRRPCCWRPRTAAGAGRPQFPASDHGQVRRWVVAVAWRGPARTASSARSISARRSPWPSWACHSSMATNSASMAGTPSVDRCFAGDARARQRACSVTRPRWWRCGDSNSTAPSCVARGQEATGTLTCGFFDPLVTVSVHGCPSLPPPLRTRCGPGIGSSSCRPHLLLGLVSTKPGTCLVLRRRGRPSHGPGGERSVPRR
jgi:hypothetical protein